MVRVYRLPRKTKEKRIFFFFYTKIRGTSEEQEGERRGESAREYDEKGREPNSEQIPPDERVYMDTEPLHTHTHKHIYIYIYYIHIHILRTHRQRERERTVYIYIYMGRERREGEEEEKERKKGEKGGSLARRGGRTYGGERVVANA